MAIFPPVSFYPAALDWAWVVKVAPRDSYRVELPSAAVVLSWAELYSAAPAVESYLPASHSAVAAVESYWAALQQSAAVFPSLY